MTTKTSFLPTLTHLTAQAHEELCAAWLLVESSYPDGFDPFEDSIDQTPQYYAWKLAQKRYELLQRTCKEWVRLGREMDMAAWRETEAL